MTTDADRSYSIPQAAALLGVHRVTLWRWIRRGRVAVVGLNRRTARVASAELHRLLYYSGSAGARVGGVRRNGGSIARDKGNGRNGTVSRALSGNGPHAHVVQFYETDTVLVEAVGAFIGAAIRNGDAGVVIATAPHRASLAERLEASGIDVSTARADGRYVTLDAHEMLARFMVDGMPDPAQFTEVIGRVVRRAAVGGRHVYAFGEMVASLAVDGQTSAALRLEELWNDLQLTHPFALYCAYPMHRLGHAGLGTFLESVCSAHSRVLPAESFTSLPTDDARDRAVAVLQQQARSLQAQVAERERAEEQLRAALEAERVAREEAEVALRARDEFLAVAAHELRTPLASLSAQAQLAQRRLRRDHSVAPMQLAPALDAMTSQVAKVSGLIDRLLDVSRLESGKLLLERQPTDLVALVTRSVTEAQLWSDRHPITVTAPTSLVATVDSVRLEQVLTNLLDNAIRYSPNGGLIEVVLDQPAPYEFELAVRDHGIGIPLEEREMVFARFAQAQCGQSRRGLGLGLYVSQQLVELHGGTIWAEGPPDGGTRLVMRLPRGTDDADQTESEPSPIHH